MATDSHLHHEKTPLRWHPGCDELALLAEVEEENYYKGSRKRVGIAAKYTSKPSPQALYEAFPDECRAYVKRGDCAIMWHLRPYIRICRRLRQSHYEASVVSVMCKIVKEIYMPKKKVERLAEFKALQQLMNKTIRGVRDDDINRAKGVDIWTLYPFHKRRGNKACCPFHDDRTPSFSVYRNKFRCFGCGVHGDSIEFMMKLNHIPFYKAVDMLNRL